MNMKKEENIKEESLDNASQQETINDKDQTAPNGTDSTDADNANADSGTANKSETDTDEAANASTQDECEKQEADPLQEALAQVELYKDKYLRSVAEFDNYRKRTLRERTELILNGSETAVKAMLPIIDDMERAIANAGNTDDASVLKEGMELIYQKTNKTFESLGVKKIDTKDVDFDTDFHEAIAMVPGMGDDKKGKVLDCVQSGYTLNDKVIRHAKVAVGQ